MKAKHLVQSETFFVKFRLGLQAQNGILWTMSNIPSDLRFAKSHEWVRVEGDVATIGISDFAQSELGDVVYVDLPSVGKKFAVGETFGSVESVKTVSDLYAPVAGEVIEVNGALNTASELVNTDPYGGGYMIKVRLDGELSGELLDATGYGAVIG
jgi:glycine cleavage system H protein